MKIFEKIPTEKPSSEILDTIESPSNLRKLELSQLPAVADELREYLLYTVGQTGGHLGAVFGAAELTPALLIAFNTLEAGLFWAVAPKPTPINIPAS